MSIGTVAARRSETSAKTPVTRPQPLPLDTAQVEALQPLLTQIVQYASAAISDCRCSIQLFEQPDAMRTVVASDMPVDAIGNAYFPLGVGVAGWVGQTCTPLLAPDVAQEPRYVGFGRQVVGAMMCVPLTDGSAFYGTMTAWSPKTGGFHRGSFAVLRATAHGATLAIGQALRARLQETAARRAGMLLALTRAVAGCDDPRYAIDLVMPMVADAVPYQTAILVTLDERDEEDVRPFTRGPQDVAVQEQLRAWAITAFREHHARGNRGPRSTSASDLVAGHMVFAVPLHAAGTPLGLIAFFHSGLFSADAQQTLQDCSYVIGTAVYNAALYRRLLLGKERFEAVFAYTVDGLLLLDERGTTALDANAAFYELTGIAPAEITFPESVAALAARWGDVSPIADAGGGTGVRRWHIAPDGKRDLEVTETEIAVGEQPHRLRVFHDVSISGVPPWSRPKRKFSPTDTCSALSMPTSTSSTNSSAGLRLKSRSNGITTSSSTPSPAIRSRLMGNGVISRGILSGASTASGCGSNVTTVSAPAITSRCPRCTPSNVPIATRRRRPSCWTSGSGVTFIVAEG